MSIVATAAALLVHIPPLTPSLRVTVADGHTVAAPVIAPTEGAAITVATCVAIAVPQLSVIAYDIVAVPPATPVTTPVLPTVATAVLPLVQEPPLTSSLKVVAAVAHTVGVPVIIPALASDVTVTTSEVLWLPQLLDTV